jgi:hypothetical protein
MDRVSDDNPWTCPVLQVSQLWKFAKVLARQTKRGRDLEARDAMGRRDGVATWGEQCADGDQFFDGHIVPVI